MIIVFADIGTKEFQIYSDAGRTTITFARADMLEEIIGLEDVLYVNSASYTSVEQLIRLADSAFEQEDEPSQQGAFIHSTKPGCLYISDLDVTFEGPKDIKSLNSLGEEIGSSPVLSQLLRAGKLEIISRATAQRLKTKYETIEQEEQQKIAQETQQRQADTQTKRPAGSRTGGEEAMQPANGTVIEGIIPLDISRGGGGGGLPSEAGLLPDDF